MWGKRQKKIPLSYPGRDKHIDFMPFVTLWRVLSGERKISKIYIRQPTFPQSGVFWHPFMWKYGQPTNRNLDRGRGRGRGLFVLSGWVVWIFCDLLSHEVRQR